MDLICIRLCIRSVFGILWKDNDTRLHPVEVGVSLLNSGEDCLNIVSEVQIVHAAALDEREHKGCMYGRIVTPALKPVITALSDTKEATLNGVVSDFK